MSDLAPKIDLNRPVPLKFNTPLRFLNLPRPQYVISETTILETVELMKSFRIGSIIVVDEKVHLKGIATERDFLMKVMGSDIGLDQPIDDVMTKNPTTLTMDDPIGMAISYMHVGRYRHIPIVNEHNSPIGIISIKDVMGYVYDSVFTP